MQLQMFLMLFITLIISIHIFLSLYISFILYRQMQTTKKHNILIIQVLSSRQERSKGKCIPQVHVGGCNEVLKINLGETIKDIFMIFYVFTSIYV